MTGLEANKNLVRRHLEEAINQRRPEVWDEIMADDFDLHHAALPPGRANYRSAVEILWAGFSDLHIEILDLLAEGDRVVVRYVERGSHDGEFLGHPPSGRSYAKHGFALYRVAEGRLAEAWVQEDDQGHQRQLFG